jgi:hypothetical protein
MRRRMFFLIAAVSLLLFVLSGIVWVRGFFVMDQFSARRRDPAPPRLLYQTIEISRGRIVYGQYLEIQNPQQAATTRPMGTKTWSHNAIPSRFMQARRAYFAWTCFGFTRVAVVRSPYIPTGPLTPNGWYVGVRLLMVMALSALLPGAWLFQSIRQRRRNAPGCCAHCGYDLRATPEGGAQLLDVCPECGTAHTAPTLAQ